MTGDERNLRPSVLELLRLYSSEEAQLRYQKDVPHVDITSELVCMWFSDTFFPESDALRSAFQPSEWTALMDFHALFSGTLERLPGGDVHEWLANPEWRAVMWKAGEALSEMAPP